MFKGRALLVIDRIHTCNPKEFRWDIHAFIQRLNRNDPGGEVGEAFSCMRHDCVPAPAAAYKMGVGDRIRVLVHFELHFTRGDGWITDDDFDLYLERQRVLKRQPYNAKRHRKASYRNRGHEMPSMR